MNKTAAFIMPVKIEGNEMELRHLHEAIDSIKNQTDPDWIIVISEDFSDDKRVYDELEKIKADLKEKIHIIYADRNHGTGVARNIGIRYAAEIGAPFILYNDADDLSDPRRLELVRKAFDADPTVNVVYTSFDVIDENGTLTPLDEVSPSVREIILGHYNDPVVGENAWINIVTKKKYTNLTSCTAVKTSLAVEEPFPPTSVSEDCHTWFRYGAHPGKFVLLTEIKGGYRIRRGAASRSRSNFLDFYEQMYNVDSDGFEQALKVAKKYGTLGGWTENDLRAAFHVRVALTILHGASEKYAKKSLEISMKNSQNTFSYIDALDCPEEEKATLKALIS